MQGWGNLRNLEPSFLYHMKKLTSLGFACAVVFLSACSKKDEEAKPSNSITGTYELVAMYVKARTELTYKENNDNMKMVSVVEYTTTENTGMLIFEANKVTANAVSYKINTNFTLETFTNGVSDGQAIEFPFNVAMPKYNSVSSYRLIGEDSLYMDQGMTQIPTGGTGQGTPAIPGGAKFVKVNGELIMTAKLNMSAPSMDAGVPGTKTQTIVQISRLKKL